LPAITATNAILIDADSAVLYDKAADQLVTPRALRS
jgi:hypothetical protein